MRRYTPHILATAARDLSTRAPRAYPLLVYSNCIVSPKSLSTCIWITSSGAAINSQDAVSKLSAIHASECTCLKKENRNRDTSAGTWDFTDVDDDHEADEDELDDGFKKDASLIFLTGGGSNPHQELAGVPIGVLLPGYTVPDHSWVACMSSSLQSKL